MVLSEAVCCVETLAPLSTCCMGLGISTKCLAVSVTQFSIHTYIHTIHNALVVVVFQEIQCLLHFHYDVGRQDVEIYPCIKFCLSQCFPSSVTGTYICH